MLDVDLILQALRDHGHTIDRVISVPENAGGNEFIVDGVTLNLDETRALLETDEARDPHAKHVHTHDPGPNDLPPSERLQ